MGFIRIRSSNKVSKDYYQSTALFNALRRTFDLKIKA